MQTLIAWLVMLALPAALWPTARVLLARSPLPADRALIACLAIALASGALTLIMLIESLLGLRWSLFTILLPLAAITAIGQGIKSQHKGTKAQRHEGFLKSFVVPLSLGAFVFIVLSFHAAAIAFNGAYWPFHRDDARAIYQPQGREMAAIGGLIPLRGADSLYLAYPMHIQSLYAFSYLASGWENEYLAKAASTLLALACLPAAYALARAALARHDTALTATLILACTPAFGSWASSGYVDLPMAFAYTLGGAFALRAWQGGGTIDAILAGAGVGLAAWTKNAALVGVPMLAGWLVLATITRRLHWRAVIAGLTAAAIVGAPFYVRNLIGAGFLMPDTAWTDQAERSIGTLLVWITRPENFGVPGVLFTLSTLWAFALWARARFKLTLSTTPIVFLLGWTLPFFAAWWLFASYDPRFLLLFMPPLCVLAALMLDWIAARLPATPRRWLMRAALAIAAVLIAVNTYYSVDYKDEILRDPFMPHPAKLMIVGRTE